MQYRKFGNLGFEISTFGMGCMRLPLKEQPDGTRKYEDIDEEEAIKMIRHAVDNGVNYFDTAYLYHGGYSERVLGKALKDGYREKVKVATKLPVWKVEKYEDLGAILDEELKRFDFDYIDFYLLHAQNKERWEKVKNLGILRFLEDARKQGKIKYIGFSFHDTLPVFKEIIDEYSWDMCQIQLNILDTDYQAGVEGLKYAASKGIPVVIMEPLKGGRLARDIPDRVKEMLPAGMSLVDIAFRWLGNFQEVTVVLSGVSTMEQLDDNIRIFSGITPGGMSREELESVQKIQEYFRSQIKVDCTSCFYCMPCPSGVDIPGIFRLYNDAFIFDAKASSVNRYKELQQNKKDASQCVECGTCESACPQRIPIIEKLKEADSFLTSEV